MSDTNKKRHYWYSEQKRRNSKLGCRPNRALRNFAKLDSGKIVEYNIASPSAEKPAFNDVVYLGQGVYDHSKR